MAISDRDFYASHGISFDIEEMQIEYTKRVIKQAKIEVLTELQLEIEKLNHKGSNCYRDGYTSYSEGLDDCRDIILQKINAIKE